MVDRIGGFEDALRYARQQAHLGKEAPVEYWPPQRTLMDSIAEAFGGGEESTKALAEALILETLGIDVRSAIAFVASLRTEHTSLALPYSINIH